VKPRTNVLQFNDKALQKRLVEIQRESQMAVSEICEFAPSANVTSPSALERYPLRFVTVAHLNSALKGHVHLAQPADDSRQVLEVEKLVKASELSGPNSDQTVVARAVVEALEASEAQKLRVADFDGRHLGVELSHA
jgi:hypothetical protein